MRPFIQRQRNGTGDGCVLSIPPEDKSERTGSGDVDTIAVGWIYLFE